MKKKMTVIYHSADFDGIFGAAGAKVEGEPKAE